MHKGSSHLNKTHFKTLVSALISVDIRVDLLLWPMGRSPTPIHAEDANYRRGGQSTVELLLAVVLFATIASGVLLLRLGSLEGYGRVGAEMQALAIAGEGMDAVRSLRDRDWGKLAPGTYGLSDASGLWEFSGTQDTEGIFTRTATVATVLRSNFCADPGSGTTEDPDARTVTVAVAWEGRAIAAETEFTRWSNPSQATCEIAPPPPASCQEVCQAKGFGGGTCRKSCRGAETYQPEGDTFCAAPNNRCCCR